MGHLAAGLAVAGDQVLTLLHPAPGATTAAGTAGDGGAEVVRLAVRGGMDLRGLRSFRSALVRFHPQVVHLHLSAPAESTMALALARTVGARAVVVSQHAPGWWPGRSRRGELLVRLAGRLAHRTAATCGAHRRLLCEEMGLAPSRVVVLPPVPPPPPPVVPRGSLRQLLEIEPGRLLVGTHGAVDRSKGTDILVHAAALSRRDDACWVVVGDGPLRRELASSSGQSERVHFIGWREDAAQLLGDLDLYVLPSRTEGFPLALIEALHAGLPVVASEVGGVPEILAPDHGRLVPAGDPEALAIAVDEMLEDRAVRTHLGGRAREAAERYLPEAMVRAHRNLYRALVGEE
jgi:glycosyltransferase involved in cell wall biosynthesis